MTVGFLRWFTFGMVLLGFGAGSASAAPRHGPDDGARTFGGEGYNYPRIALNIVYCLAPDGTVNQISDAFPLGCRSGTLPAGSREIDEAEAKAIQDTQEPATPTKSSATADTLDGAWKGNMRCGDENRMKFGFQVSGGRFSYAGNSFEMRGEIKDGGYDISGTLATGQGFSFSGSVGDGQINDSSTSLFSGTCYVNLFRFSTPEQQQAINAARRLNVKKDAEAKKREVAELKARYERMLAEEERQKRLAEAAASAKPPAPQATYPARPQPAPKARLLASGGLMLPLRASEAGGAAVVEEVALYGSSHALVIGIDEYTGGWPRLSMAVRDARLMAAALEEHGFKVRLLLNPKGDELEDALETFFLEKGEEPDARLFVWFAGHGHTENGEGYIVPADAPLPRTRSRFRRSALSLRRLGEYVRQADSKHAFVVFDSCFSGTVFQSARALPPAAVTRATTLPVRQFLTSGDAGQTVSDDGTFRELFIRALRGEERADANGDGYITASEMGLFLSDRITNLTESKQTPRYGKLRDKDWDRGDFVFALASPGQAVLPRAPAPAERPVVRLIPMDEEMVAVKNANVRAEPTTRAAKIGGLKAGATVGVTGRAKVGRATWYQVALAGGETGYVFGTLLKEAAVSAPPKQAAPTPEPKPIDKNIELTFWQSIQASERASDYEAYLKQFPDGTFAALARSRVQQFGGQKTAALAPPKQKPPAAVRPDEAHSQLSTLNPDQAFWKSIENSNDRVDFEEYLKRFPNGNYIELARLQLERLPVGAVEQAPVTRSVPSASEDLYGMWSAQCSENEFARKLVISADELKFMDGLSELDVWSIQGLNVSASSATIDAGLLFTAKSAELRLNDDGSISLTHHSKLDDGGYCDRVSSDLKCADDAAYYRQFVASDARLIQCN